MGGLDRVATLAAAAIVEGAVRSLLLGVCAGLAIRFARVRSAALQLCVWTTVLCAAIASPAVGAMAPSNIWSLSIPLPPHAGAGDRLTSYTFSEPANGAAEPAAAMGAASTLASNFVTQHSPEQPRRISLTTLAVAAYLAVAFALLAKIALGWAATTRASRRSRSVMAPDLVARCFDCAAAAGITRAPRVVELLELRVPITFGVLAPVIALPASWREWNPVTLDAVLVHELAHVARRDALTQLAALAYRAIFWFSPFSWWLHRRLVDLAEEASDEAVLASGVDRVTYAETLVAFFRAMSGTAARSDCSVAMATGDRAERRVERVLAWKSGASGRISRAAVLIVAIGATPIVLIAAESRATFVPVDLPGFGTAPTIVRVDPPASSIPTWVEEKPSAPAPVEPQSAATGPAATPSAQESPFEFSRLARDQSQRQSAVTSTLDAVRASERSLPPSFRTRRMIALVFRPQALSSQDLRVATRMASMMARDMFARADVGLDVFHVVAVQIAGPEIETIQDFTGDPDLIDAALTTVAARGSDASSGDDLTLLEKVCDNLAGRSTAPLSTDERTANAIGTYSASVLDSRAALYFLSGVKEGSEEVARAIVPTCLRTGVTLLPVSIPHIDFGSQSPADRRLMEWLSLNPPRPAVSFDLVTHQAGAPVTLTQSTSTIDYGYASVRIRNDSPKRIRSVTLAALVWPSDPALKSPQIFSRVGPVASIEPGESLEIASQLIDADTLNHLLVHGTRAEVGVIGVDFADGTKWSYDLAGKGHFEPDH